MDSINFRKQQRYACIVSGDLKKWWSKMMVWGHGVADLTNNCSANYIWAFICLHIAGLSPRMLVLRILSLHAIKGAMHDTLRNSYHFPAVYCMHLWLPPFMFRNLAIIPFLLPNQSYEYTILESRTYLLCTCIGWNTLECMTVPANLFIRSLHVLNYFHGRQYDKASRKYFLPIHKRQEMHLRTYFIGSIHTFFHLSYHLISITPSARN